MERFRAVVGSRLYGAPLAGSDLDLLSVGDSPLMRPTDQGEWFLWTEGEFITRVLRGFPAAVQALYAPKWAVLVGEPLEGLRDCLPVPTICEGLRDWTQANLSVARLHQGWSKALWQALVACVMREELLQRGTLPLPLPLAPFLLRARTGQLPLPTVWAFVENSYGIR